VTFFITQFDSLTPDEIGLLHRFEDEGHEIGSHGALHVLSEHYIREHSYQDYLEKEIGKNLQSMRKHGFNPRSFAIPMGQSIGLRIFCCVILLI